MKAALSLNLASFALRRAEVPSPEPATISLGSQGLQTMTLLPCDVFSCNFGLCHHLIMVTLLYNL